MTRRREAAVASKAVADVRMLQRHAAEATVARAAAALAERNRATADACDARDEALSQWRAALSRPDLSFVVAPFWSREIMTREAACRDADAGAENARVRLDKASAVRGESVARSDFAQQQSRRASAEWRREIDEVAAHEAIERYAQRRHTR